MTKKGLLSNGVFQSAFTVAGVVTSMAISAVSMILLSRFLGPTSFGVFSVGFSLIIILGQTADLGINFSMNKLINPKDSTARINNVFSISTRIKIYSSLIFLAFSLLVLSLFSHSISKQVQLISLIAVLLFPVTMWFDHLLYMLRSVHAFYKSVAITISQSVLKLATIVLLFYTNTKSEVTAFVIYSLIPAVPLVFSKYYFDQKIKINLLTKSKIVAGQISSLMKHTAVLLFAQTILDNADVILTRFFATPLESGVFAGVAKISLLITFSAYALGMVLNPRAARYKSYADISNFYLKGWAIVLISIVGFAMVFLIQSPLLAYSIGSEYFSGLNTLSILNISAFATLAMIPFIAVFYSLKNDWFFSALGIIQVLSFLLLSLVLGPGLQGIGIAMAKAISRILGLIFSILTATYAVRRKKIIFSAQ